MNKVHVASKLKALLLAVGAVGLFVFAPHAAFAESLGIGGRPAHPDPNNDRTKSIFVKTIKPGASASDEVEVINNSNQTQKVLVYATDSVVSSGGAFACAQASDPIKGAGAWISLAKSEVQVPANGSVKVPFTITAPTSAEAGEQDACIILQQDKQTTVQSGVGLSFRTGLRVAVLIPGNIIKAITPVGLSVQQKSDHIIVAPQVKNTGTVSVDATIQANIQTLFGTTVTSRDSVFPVLRGQTGEWNIELDRPFWGGIYKAHYDISYDKSSNFIGQKAQPKDIEHIAGQTAYFFAFPSMAGLFIELVVLAGVIVGGFFLVRALGRRRHVRLHWTTHTVEAEQLSDIAARHNVSWKQLAKVNRIKAPYQLKAGQVIKVPVSGADVAKPKK